MIEFNSALPTIQEVQPNDLNESNLVEIELQKKSDKIDELQARIYQ